MRVTVEAGLLDHGRLKYSFDSYRVEITAPLFVAQELACIVQDGECYTFDPTMLVYRLKGRAIVEDLDLFGKDEEKLRSLIVRQAISTLVNYETLSGTKGMCKPDIYNLTIPLLAYVKCTFNVDISKLKNELEQRRRSEEAMLYIEEICKGLLGERNVNG